MKRLNRKETRFIALILAVCMIIGILYINDRDKVALADSPSISYSATSISDLNSCITVEGETVNVVKKTLKFIVGTNAVSVNVVQIASAEGLKSPFTGIKYVDSDGEDGLNMTLSSTNTSIKIYVTKPNPTELNPDAVTEELCYEYIWSVASVGFYDPTLSFDSNYDAQILVGEENDIDASRFQGNLEQGAGSGNENNIFVGQVKYCIDKNSDTTDETDFKSYSEAKSSVNETKDYESDGTYYLHKAYFVGETKVCDCTITSPSAVRMSTPAAPINDTPTVQKVVGTEGTTLTPSEGKYGGVNVGDTIQICITTSDTATSVKWNGTENSTSTGDDTIAHTKGWTYEFVLGNAANNGDVTVTYKIKSKKGDDDEPDYDGSITLSVGDSKPVISDELTVKDADDNSISPIEGKYYVKKDVDNVFITTKVTMPTNANGATVSGVTIGEDGDGNPVPATLVTEGGNQYTVAAGTPVVDGANDIEITAKSSTGLSATPKTVTVVRDNAAPTISNFKLFQTGLDASGVGNIGGANEEDATTEQPDAPLTSTKAFSINFNLADAGGSSLDASSLHVYRKIGNGTESEVPATEDSGTQGLYVVNEDFTAKPSGCFNNVITYRVEVADKAGNVATMFYKYKFINETITVQPVVKAIEQVLSPYEEGTTKFRTDLSKIYVEYTVTTNDVKLQLSDLPAFNYDGADITIRAKAKDGMILKDINGEYGDADKALVSTGTEPYKYVFVVEYEETESASRSNITADFKNVNGYSVTDKITIISVDLTDPTATLNGDENTWYSSLVIKITCKDKDGNYYSGLKTAKLTQSGGVSGNGEQNILSGDPTEIPSFTVAQSSSVSGTTIKINVEDNVGRTYSVSKTYHVDEDKPTKENFTVGGITAENIGDKVYEGDPVVAFGIKDNLNIAAYKLTVESPVGTKTVEGTNPGFTDSVKSVSSSKKVSEIIGQAVANGTYTLTLTAKDSAGNALDTVTTKFIVDNTKPVNDVIITTAKPAKFEKYHSSYSNPESGVSYEYGQYYAGKVSVDLQVIDDNVDTNDIVVTDNGDRVNVSWSAATINGKAGYKASYSTSNEGSHTITIATTDRAGQKATAKAVTYNVDNTAPTITASLNGSAISGGSGVRYLNVNGNVVVTANDKYFDEDDFTRVVKRTTPDKAVNNDTSNISNGSTPYTTDADYEITYKVVDRAGRETTLGPIEFRVDKVAPKLEVTGAASGGTARTNVSASMIITEDFYWDMTSVTCKIYKKVDGQGERLFEDVKVNPTSARTAINRALAEDGEYRFEMEATDKCGNHTTYTYSFIVDANAPLIELSGVKNYDSTDKAVDLIVKVTENFYTTNKLSISGTRTDINGDVEKLNLTGYNVNAAKVTTIPQQFKEDGIYDINVRSVDKAGNEDNKKVHFTIDSKAPIIKSLPEYDGTLFSEFKWDEDPDDLVTDLTVCQVTILMDGVEYDGLTELSDGSHTLRIEAVDELGHESSAEYTFLVDTKPPTILVTGVENGEVILEERNIDISLQLDEDMLRSVTLNGKAISVANNTAKLTINEKGTYTLKVEAVDKAGNVSTIEYTFTFGKTANWWWLIILIAAILLLLIIFFIIYKNRWNQKN